MVVDSIQTVWLPESEAYAGSVPQVRDCTQALMEYAKRTGCARFIVGHVTKDGAIAGPRLLEHLVDTVLYFEGETQRRVPNPARLQEPLRLGRRDLRFYDARCGVARGRQSFGAFLGRPHAAPQRIVRRCIDRRVAAGAHRSPGARRREPAYGTPRRLANNLDQQRLAMIIAVLERRAGFSLGGHDVYASVAGGLRISEPAADLGIALAIASSFRNVAIPMTVAVFGELGLSGEVRAVAGAERREAEARKLGYADLISPANTRDIVAAIKRGLAAGVMAMLFEIVPNLSEGRNAGDDRRGMRGGEADRARGSSTRSSDAVHHRSVLTIVGDGAQVVDAAVALAGVALERIDLREHRGVHPRIGALDVLPFVPLRGATLHDAAVLAHRAGAEIWRRYRIPSFYYGAAARGPSGCCSRRSGARSIGCPMKATCGGTKAPARSRSALATFSSRSTSSWRLPISRRRERSRARFGNATGACARFARSRCRAATIACRSRSMLRIMLQRRSIASSNWFASLRPNAASKSLGCELIGCLPLAAVESAAAYYLGVTTLRSVSILSESGSEASLRR